MSRLTDLIAQAKAENPQLGTDLDHEFKQLSSHRLFGLNSSNWRCSSRLRHSPLLCRCQARRRQVAKALLVCWPTFAVSIAS